MRSSSSRSQRLVDRPRIFGSLVCLNESPRPVLFLNLHHHLDLADAIFWGIWLIPFGLLVYKSRFLPRLLGVWLMAGCFAYLALSFAGFLFPAYEEKVFAIGTPFRIGELTTMLWLVIMGANEKRPVAAKS
jgi:hypothetical protein